MTMRLTWIVMAAAALAVAPQAPDVRAPSTPPSVSYTLTSEDKALLEDLSRRSFEFFWEQADPSTGIVRDRARTDASTLPESHREIGSIASTGFGLTGLCIAADRKWRPAAELKARAVTTLRFFADRASPSTAGSITG